jgi:hypothetical protein
MHNTSWAHFILWRTPKSSMFLGLWLHLKRFFFILNIEPHENWPFWRSSEHCWLKVAQFFVVICTYLTFYFFKALGIPNNKQQKISTIWHTYYYIGPMTNCQMWYIHFMGHSLNYNGMVAFYGQLRWLKFESNCGIELIIFPDYSSKEIWHHCHEQIALL